MKKKLIERLKPLCEFPFVCDFSENTLECDIGGNRFKERRNIKWIETSTSLN
jgi:hypothetical protein